MKICALAALAISAGATAANADTVRLQFTGTGAGQQIRPTLNGSSFNCFAGQLNHLFSNGTGVAAGLTGTHATYCTDLTQNVSSGGTTYTVTPIASLPVSSGQPPMGSIRAQAVYNLYAGAGATASGTSDSTTAAAFQIVLWEIVYDYSGTAASLNLTSGNLRVQTTGGSNLSGTLLTKINQFFALAGVAAPQTGLMGFSSGSAQDQILPVTVVPIPAALPVGLAGLGLVALVRRRLLRA